MTKNEPLGCLFAIFKIFGIPLPSGKPEPLPYRRRDWLFSRAERSFYGVLCDAVDEEYLVFAKVRIADILYLPRSTESRQSHQNRIQSKHIDFLLCDREKVRPLLAIELDDKSHLRADRRERDDFVDAAFADAGLPLLHVPTRSAYNVAELRTQVEQKLGQTSNP